MNKEEVVVRTKTYSDCYHIQTVVTTGGGAQTTDAWEAPHLGTVKTVVPVAFDGRYILVLKEFKLVR